MQNAVFKPQLAMEVGTAGCMQSKATAMPVCRSTAPPCNRMCAGLHPQERFACAWRRVRAGQSLYLQGEPLHSIFVVRSGSFKSTLTLGDGSTRICAFPAAGDVIALDGLGASAGGTTMTALDDAHVCAIATMPRAQGPLFNTDMRSRLGRLMSDEILRTQKLLVLMAGSSAQERMGVFLWDLSRQQLARGYSGRDFTLRMTRSDIGSFLGMAMETVSRSLAGMQAQGGIKIAGRRIQINDLKAFSRQYAAWQ